MALRADQLHLNNLLRIKAPPILLLRALPRTLVPELHSRGLQARRGNELAVVLKRGEAAGEEQQVGGGLALDAGDGSE